MVEAKEQALIEQLIAHAAVEAFAEAVLHGFAWRDEVSGDPALVRPGEHRVRGELGSMVGDDHACLAPPLDQPCQFARHARPRDRGVGNGGKAFPSDVIDHVRMRRRRPQAS